jgi:hypothetical protein
MELWTPKWPINRRTPIATAGSCFAQHISKALIIRGFNWINGEIGPPGMTSCSLKKYNYGVFSFRTGNIYSVALLKQWLLWALEIANPPGEVWENGGKYYDPFRPEIEPDGFSSFEELIASRNQTLYAIKKTLESTRLFIFTLGLTESWINVEHGYVYPSCPGTHHGIYSPRLHKFKNFTFNEIRKDLLSVMGLLKTINQRIRILLTVSPVPLVATASQNHVLVATLHSKSVLRAIAGELANQRHDLDYFPSYELIASHPFKGEYYEDNMRTVTSEGVQWVMSHFFHALQDNNFKVEITDSQLIPSKLTKITQEDILCEEELLAQFENLSVKS